MKKIILYISAFVLALATVTSLPYTALAQSSNYSEQCDENFFSSNDILFYNPCTTSCSAGSSAATGTIDALHGKNNAEKMFNFWVDAGMSAQQAAGIIGSMKHEGEFSPFRQQQDVPWPRGGWGIAQFTLDPGQRGSATKFVREAVGDDMFDQYYKNEYGGYVLESNGFIPKGVPLAVNDAFLLAQLNYLLSHTKSFKPSTNSIRTGLIAQDYGQTVPEGMTLYDYLKTIIQAGDTAIAWTYLYEMPDDVKSTAAVRASSAEAVLSLYSNGISTGCGGNLSAGGMNLEQAKKFMEEYTSNPSNVQYIGGADRGCVGGPLSNCVSFSVYFLNKYTTLQGFQSGSTGNGGAVAGNIIARNPTVENGHSPRPYAIFSTANGSQSCGATLCGHTGVILGVDTARGKVIVGEAGCGTAASWDTAREYNLSQFESDSYTYVYTDGVLKGAIQ